MVSFSGVFGLIGGAWASAYTTSKFAVRGFTEALGEELESRGSKVRCTAIKTEIVGNAVISLECETATSQSERSEAFVESAPTTAARTAELVVDAVVNQRRRVVIGPDAHYADLIQRCFAGNYRRALKRLRPIQGALRRILR